MRESMAAGCAVPGYDVVSSWGGGMGGLRVKVGGRGVRRVIVDMLAWLLENYPDTGMTAPRRYRLCAWHVCRNAVAVHRESASLGILGTVAAPGGDVMYADLHSTTTLVEKSIWSKMETSQSGLCFLTEIWLDIASRFLFPDNLHLSLCCKRLRHICASRAGHHKNLYARFNHLDYEEA